MFNHKITFLKARMARLESRIIKNASPVFEVVLTKTNKELTSGTLDALMKDFKHEPKVLHGLQELKKGHKVEAMVETSKGWAVIREGGGSHHGWGHGHSHGYGRMDSDGSYEF